MNPLSLVADCDAVSLTGDAVDPGTVRWVLEASRVEYAVTLVTVYEHYDPFPEGEAVGRPEGNPPEGLYCLAGIVSDHLGTSLHVAGPLRHGWPPRPIMEFADSTGRDGTRRCAWEEHPHGRPETWDEAGGCTYPGCPVAIALARCQEDMGATRLGGQRIICGKPLPCPEHTPLAPAHYHVDDGTPCPTARPDASIDTGYTCTLKPGRWVAARTPRDTSDVLRCTALVLQRDHCGRPLPCPEHSTQGQGDDLATQQISPQAGSDVRAPAHEDRCSGYLADGSYCPGPHDEDGRHTQQSMCLVVVYGGSGAPGTGLRLCGQRLPCAQHIAEASAGSDYSISRDEAAEALGLPVEHDETCQHDDEPADTYCGFDYPHQPHVPETGVPCPGKVAPSIYDGPRQGATS